MIEPRGFETISRLRRYLVMFGVLRGCKYIRHARTNCDNSSGGMDDAGTPQCAMPRNHKDDHFFSCCWQGDSTGAYLGPADPKDEMFMRVIRRADGTWVNRD